MKNTSSGTRTKRSTNKKRLSLNCALPQSAGAFLLPRLITHRTTCNRVKYSTASEARRLFWVKRNRCQSEAESAVWCALPQSAGTFLLPRLITYRTACNRVKYSTASEARRLFWVKRNRCQSEEESAVWCALSRTAGACFVLSKNQILAER